MSASRRSSTRSPPPPRPRRRIIRSALSSRTSAASPCPTSGSRSARGSASPRRSCRHSSNSSTSPVWRAAPRAARGSATSSSATSAAAKGNAQSHGVADYARAQGAAGVVISAAIEAEVAQLADEMEKREFLHSLGLAEAGLARVIHAGYRLLDLITFFTVGPKEAHAWTVAQRTTAPQAAGVIHSDFEQGFIRAETISYADFVAHGGEQGAKEAGKMRLEGADYMIQDGDILHFRFNV